MNSGASATHLLPVDIDSAAPRRHAGTLARSEDPVGSGLPLVKVSTTVRVVDRVAEVSMSQTFVNSYPDPIEAVYVFPLPGGCSVSSFEMTVRGRSMRAVLAEREQARRDYQEALDQGHSAAILEQERDDIFTVSVGNLPAGDEAAVTLVYVERLPLFHDGWTELRVPLVVAPRYIPGSPLDGASVGDGTEPDTNQVPDASRITPPRLVPGFDPRTSVQLNVDLYAPVSGLACSQHAVQQSFARDRVKIELSRTDELLDRDFVLRWRPAAEGITPSLVYAGGDDGEIYGLLSMMAVPAKDTRRAESRDVVFVLDRSGSMQGEKMVSAARACDLLLQTLGPADRFAIVAFANGLEWFEVDGGQPPLVAADEDGRGRASRWLHNVEASGGTEAAPALAAAFSFLSQRRGDPGAMPAVVFITDGAVGNEDAIVAQVQRTDPAIRLFAVGVDTAVSEGFLRRLADLGRGTSMCVTPGTALEGALTSIGRDIGRPLVTDLTIAQVDGTGFDTTALAPSSIGDLFEGHATDISFRSKTAGPVRVRGTRSDGTAYEVVVDGRTVDMPAIAQLWARARVADLEDRYRVEPRLQEAIRKEIVATSIRHRVLSRFTAYLALDREQALKDRKARRKIVQPVHFPAGWRVEEPYAMFRVAEPSFSHVQEMHRSVYIASADRIAKPVDMRDGNDSLHVAFKRLHAIQKGLSGDADRLNRARALVDELLGLLQQRRAASMRFEELVRALVSLSAHGGSRWHHEAEQLLEDSRKVLWQLREIDDRFERSLQTLESLSASGLSSEIDNVTATGTLWNALETD